MDGHCIGVVHTVEREYHIVVSDLASHELASGSWGHWLRAIVQDEGRASGHIVNRCVGNRVVGRGVDLGRKLHKGGQQAVNSGR